jgi:hypothetical protein
MLPLSAPGAAATQSLLLSAGMILGVISRLVGSTPESSRTIKMPWSRVGYFMLVRVLGFAGRWDWFIDLYHRPFRRGLERGRRISGLGIRRQILSTSSASRQKSDTWYPAVTAVLRPTADPQPCRRELHFMPHPGHWLTPRRSSSRLSFTLISGL